MKKHILFILVIWFATGSAHALENFIPGKYSLKSGDAEQCGAGKFEVRGGGTNVGFGAMHGFNLANNTETLRGDAPGEEACVYQGQDSIEILGAKTVLTFVSKKICADALVYTLTKRADVEKNHVQMSVIQTGNPQFHYNCNWVKKGKS